MLTLDDVLAYFGSARKRTRQVAECIPPDRIEWRHQPQAFSLGDLVRHLAVAERHVWAETVSGGPSSCRTHGPELADGKEPVRLLGMLEHEAHHRGQMYTLLTMIGASAPSPYGMTDEQVRAAIVS